MQWPAWAVDAWLRVKPYADRLAVWRGYEAELQTLLIYGVGIAIYTALVFTFYQSLSKRKPFHITDRKDWVGRATRFAENALVFPVLSFLYFAVLAVALIFLAKTQSTPQILLISMAVVVGVRVTVYLSEAMSNDLAKLVPLSLLGVLLVDPGYLTLEQAWVRLAETTTLTQLLGRYFLSFIALEAVLGTVRWSIVRGAQAWREHRAARKATPAATQQTTLQIVVKEGSTPSPTPPADAAPKDPAPADARKAP